MEMGYGKEFLQSLVAAEMNPVLPVPIQQMPREAVAAPLPLEVSKASLDRALNFWDSRMCLCPWQGWTWMIFKTPSIPIASGIL